VTHELTARTSLFGYRLPNHILIIVTISTDTQFIRSG